MMRDHHERSIGAIFQDRSWLYGEQTMLTAINAAGDTVEISWNRMNKMVRSLAQYLLRRGVAPGDRVAVVSPNRWECWLADLAILSIGAVNVPLDPDGPAQATGTVLSDTAVEICFAASRGQLTRMLGLRDTLPGLQEIITFDDGDAAGVTRLADALREGQAITLGERFDTRLAAMTPHDPAAIIYTAGDSRRGLILTHANLIGNVRQCLAIDTDLTLRQRHVCLSLLPPALAAQRILGIYLPIYSGHRLVLIEDPAGIQKHLRAIRPTCITAAPGFYEELQAAAMKRAPHRPENLAWTMGMACRNLVHACSDNPRRGIFALKYHLAERLVFAGMKSVLGLDRVALALCVGGTLPNVEFFLGLDLPVLEGFGLAETCPCCTINRPGHIRPGSAGTPLKDTRLKISPAGEVLVKGPQVPPGYYNDSLATRQAFDHNGFLKTGRYGRLDDDGCLLVMTHERIEQNTAMSRPARMRR